MKNLLSIGLPICFGISLILGSCARDNSVASNHRIQKRKYNTGYHIAFNKKKKNSVQEEIKSTSNELAIASQEPEQTKIENNISFYQETSTYNSEKKSTYEDQIKGEQFDFVQQEKFGADVDYEQELKNNSYETALVDNGTKSPKQVIRKVNEHKLERKSEKKSMRIESIVYIILCIFLPPVAVGLATRWDPTQTLISILLTIFFWLPGIIYAFYVCDKEGVL